MTQFLGDLDVVVGFFFSLWLLQQYFACGGVQYCNLCCQNIEKLAAVLIRMCDYLPFMVKHFVSHHVCVCVQYV